MSRPTRILENGSNEYINNEEYLEFLTFNYRNDLNSQEESQKVETITDFYNDLVHDILRFHAGQLNVLQFLERMNESHFHFEAYKKALNTIEDRIKFN